MDGERVSTTVVVSPLDAMAYMQAGFETPGVEVEVFVPNTPAEKIAAVCEHIATLLRDGDELEPNEVPEFVAAAEADVWAAFEDETDPAVLVRIITAVGSTGVKQAEQVSQLALQCMDEPDWLPMSE